jgi:molecular chaperone DnaK
VIVGKAAKQAEAHVPDKVATYVKRDIGKPLFSRTVNGRQFRPETLSAMILKKMKQDAERRIGPITRAVITVPAFFDDTRRKATEDAGRIAGLETVHIINEPTAAALAYCLEARLDKNSTAQPDFPDGKLTALVYDLGGGTFDVTVVRLEHKRIDTLATDGAVKLGGKDWDDRIARFIIQEFAAKHRVQVEGDRQTAIGVYAESTKKLLSQLPSAPVECFHQDQVLRSTLTRSQFEEMTRDLLAQTEAVTNLVVKQVQIREPAGEFRKATWGDIDRVLLVGGSTRMPMVKEMLRRTTGKEPDDSLDPDQVVARGAAIYSALLAAQGETTELALDGDLQRELQDIGVIDVNAHSLGVEAFNHKTKKMVNAIVIPKNRQLPFAASQVFRTVRPGATSVQVKVLEGEAPDAAANIQLGQCHVTELPPNLPANSPVQVRLSFGANGRVSVMALDMTGGRFAHAEIERKAGLSEDDIRRETEFVNSLNIQ